MRVLGLRLVTIVLATGGVLACGHTPSVESEVRGSDLRSIIEEQIKDNVRESYGELAGQNFSDVDLDRFMREKVPDRVAASLRSNPRFLAAVEKVRAMPAADRGAYLKRCRQPLRRTWAQLGEITPKGTTEAGQRAEIAIAAAITDVAESLLAAPARR